MPIRKSWDILSKVNAHPRDECIDFEEKEHRYRIRGSDTGWTSVTSLLAFLSEPFDKEKVADGLIAGKRYQDGSHPLAGKTKEEIMGHWDKENQRGTALHARMEYGMNLRCPARPSREESEFMDVFQYEGREVECDQVTGEVFIATEGGAGVEYLSLGYRWPDGSIRRNPHGDAELGDAEPILGFEEAFKEARQVYLFWKRQAHLEPYRSEWVIWDEDYKIAGTIDAVFRDTRDGTYWIYDWKRVAAGLEVDLEATRFGYRAGQDEWLQEIKPWVKKMAPPVSDLYDTKYWHYALQLNLYKTLLEKNYGITIAGMVLVQLHPTLRSYKCHSVVHLPEQISRLLERRKEEVAQAHTGAETGTGTGTGTGTSTDATS